jgi:polar amino acid transport system permease protein
LISTFAAAVLGLTLNQAAFSAEIIRGGILSVDHGQFEAAAALGLPRWRQITRIVLPQAMRTILPGAFNDVISLAKGTSMVYILALPELFYTIQVIYRRNLEVVPLLMVATVWYLIILTLLSAIQVYVERHFSRGALRELSPGLFPSWRKHSGPYTGAEDATPLERRASDVATPAAEAASSNLAAVLGRGGAVAIHGVSKSFGSLRVLDDINLDIPAGSVTVILGPSGSGKSTLLRTINHLERVDAGFIAVDGKLLGYRREGDTLHELHEPEIRRRRADIGMVFQNFNLFPHLSVLENLIEAPIAVRGMERLEAERQARTLLARIGLMDNINAYPRQLSGGQQQRVAIARALALKPKVLLFDEPTSALDPELVNEVLAVIEELARTGVTLIVVTHETGFARKVADTIVFLDKGQILETGKPDQIFNAPAHSRTAEFLAKVL